MNISFIGIGVMGSPMAQNLVTNSGHKVTVFDIDSNRIQQLETIGGISANSIAHAVKSADIVMTSLPGPEQIERVAFAPDGLVANISPGAVWIDLSTNNLDLCQKILKASLETGFEFLDSPVSGGDEGARAGSLTIMVGGESQIFDKYLPILKIIGSNITLLGSGGAGYAAKISQVVLCYLHSLALSEALMLGIKGGVDPGQMLKIVQNSTGASYVANRYGPPILNGDYDPSFTLGLALKDLKLAQQMAKDLEISLPMCDLTTATYARAVEEFGFESNHLKAVRLLEQDNNTYLRG